MPPNPIQHRSSPNYSSRGGSAITHVIIHVTEGNAPGCIDWLCNPKSQVSAHYVVDRDGTITQLVEEFQKAWHACNANPFSIGVEHEGFSAHNDMPDVQLMSS